MGATGSGAPEYVGTGAKRLLLTDKDSVKREYGAASRSELVFTIMTHRYYATQALCWKSVISIAYARQLVFQMTAAGDDPTIILSACAVPGLAVENMARSGKRWFRPLRSLLRSFDGLINGNCRPLMANKGLVFRHSSNIHHRNSDELLIRCLYSLGVSAPVMRLRQWIRTSGRGSGCLAIATRNPRAFKTEGLEVGRSAETGHFSTSCLMQLRENEILSGKSG